MTEQIGGWQPGTATPSSRVREHLDHPVIDIDGHTVDFAPLFEEYVREYAGPRGVELFHRQHPWFAASPERRALDHLSKRTWGFPTGGTVDHLTNVIPALLEERLGELGLDFSIIYPSPNRIGVPHQRDQELRAPLCRAINHYQADVLAPHAGRMTPAALIPMDNPAEAIAELEFAVDSLGLRVVQLAAFCIREVPAANGSAARTWWDLLALDSEHDYDQVWTRCQELQLAPTFHSATMGLGPRASCTNAVYNHVGHFAAASESICKALLLGGVTRRFPDLKFAFLESGVGWAASLLADLAGHFDKRNVAALTNLTPENLDYEVAAALLERYGSPAMRDLVDRVGELGDRIDWPVRNEDVAAWDDFRAAGIASVEDLVARFAPSFFFGCEGDDPMNALAFDPELLPGGARLRIVYGSDIGHWDVPRLDNVLHEAYELVEAGRLHEEDFRDFVFANPIRLYAGTNPAFFAGTAVEAAVASEVERLGITPAAQ